jgi:uncharacterized protein (TIGR02217 family)
MGFLEQRFPEGISYGSAGGPGFDTRVHELDSGQFQKIRRRSQARRTFDVAEQVKTLAQMIDIRDFYLSIGGVANDFRFKDWTDYTSNADNVSSPLSTDQPCSPATGDGTNKDFQMIKVYSRGSFTHTRTILKPVDGTGLVSVDDTPQVSGFSINYATGVITFTSAPSAGEVIKWGAEYDVPVGFAMELDRQIAIAIEFFDGGEIPDIPLVETLNPDAVSEVVPMRGAKNHGTISASITIAQSDAGFHVVAPDTASLQVKLPQTANMPAGGPWFAVKNTGSQSIDVATSGGTPIITVAVGAMAELWLGFDSGGSKVWIGK